jgi:malonyl-CoA O-methyltransferase
MKIGEIERCFDRVAPDYENHDGLEREIGERLLQRVVFARRPPSRILDLGCGTGRCTGALKASFGNAEVIGLDLSRGMLRGLKAN